MTKIEEIYAACLPELGRLGLEATTLNRCSFLYGVYEAWTIADDIDKEKMAYIKALADEIKLLLAELQLT